jgi:hypothetical protein
MTVLAFREIKSIEEAQKLIGCSYTQTRNLGLAPMNSTASSGIGKDRRRKIFRYSGEIFPRGATMFRGRKRERNSHRPRMKWCPVNLQRRSIIILWKGPAGR